MRTASSDDIEVYQVIVTTRWPDSPRSNHVQVYGPYRTLNAAKGQATQKTKDRNYGIRADRTAIIKRAVTTWEVVE